MKTLFVVDDESLAISRLRQLLKSFSDIQVVGDARTVEDAVSQIRKLKPDLVFLDVELGDSTGFEVIEQVRASGADSRFIILSAYSHYAITAIRYKVDDYLLKPVDLNELRGALERNFHQSKHSSDRIAFATSIPLTPREKSVLSGMLDGKTSQQIADELFLSKHTVDTFRRRILSKSGAKNTMELISKIR
jgi:DNA-binding NarL/FixJ family response regulator